MILSTNLSGILFIDLTASAAGENENATANTWLKSQRVTQTLSLVSEAIFNHRGVVTKKLADGLIATFPDANTTLKAVLKLEDQLNTAKEATGNDTHWRLGLHLAKLHVIAGSVAGEGLEHAVELASLAGGEQILLSAAMADALKQESLPENIQLVVADEGSDHSPQTWQLLIGNKVADSGATSDASSAPETDTTPLPEPVTETDITALSEPETATETDIPPLPDHEAETAPLPIIPRPEKAAVTPIPTPPDNAGQTRVDGPIITLSVAGETYQLDANNPKITFGRGKNNDVRIKGTHVSREHAYFEIRDGNGIFVDLSANGSCLIDGSQESLLHQQTLVLVGEGEIGLGPTREKSPDHLIKFSLN